MQFLPGDILATPCTSSSSSLRCITLSSAVIDVIWSYLHMYTVLSVLMSWCVDANRHILLHNNGCITIEESLVIFCNCHSNLVQLTECCDCVLHNLSMCSLSCRLGCRNQFNKYCNYMCCVHIGTGIYYFTGKLFLCIMCVWYCCHRAIGASHLIVRYNCADTIY